MGTLIRAGGAGLTPPEYVAPATPPAFTLEELQGFVGGYIEALRLHLKTADDGEPLWLILNEQGKLENLPFNGYATYLARSAGAIDPADHIVGDVIVCTTTEAGGSV